MKTFEYEVAIEGRITFARPRVGEEIVIDGVVYVVRRVQHQEDDGRTVQVYTWPRRSVRAKRKT